jgi:Ca2+-binding RTX toxin-like protein
VAATSSALQSGSWGPVIQFPTIPIHAHLLPTGNVMFWDRHWEDLPELVQTLPHIWNPTTGLVFGTPHPGLELFCSGHSFLGDGRLFVAGGHDMEDGFGLVSSFAYDSAANTWTRLADMNAGRWYPTSTTLGNGDVLVNSGSIVPGVSNQVPQVYNVATNSWRALSSAAMEWRLYPMMQLAPNGLVFNPGPDIQSFFVNPSGPGALAAGPVSNSGDRDYGNAVMYDSGKLALIGGGYTTSAVEVIDLNAPAPTWRTVASMASPRRQHNSIILADGKVLVTGGNSTPVFSDAAGAVLAAELWDPATETWQTLAAQVKPRLYHSVSVLLPDGRVVSGGGGHPPGDNGGGNNNDIEIFSPPYLSQGPRPVIQTAPGRATWGQTISLGTSSPGSIQRVNLIRATAVTHSTNMDQRLNRLSFTTTPTGLSVRIPGNPNVTPPGPYMLFIVNNLGVPSVAARILIGHGDPVAFCQQSGMNVIIGTSNNDNLTGTAGADCIVALGGQDTVNAGGGNDVVFGGDGNDTLNGGSGNDAIFGGTGQDIISGVIGDDVLFGDDGDDQISGGDGADTLVGGLGQDRGFGDGGNDLLLGEGGDDQLFGGDGNDVITDCCDHNRLEGGNGSDQCQSDPADSTSIGCEISQTNFCG